ncbi:hypothetical protein RHSIM_Rhsim12G0066800 [Rhododendron simsii]|uniref:Protein kinase domain-containing protein n=1 Tax=Rhododendron simsii TaxID=118357 RepID=A0A834L853_RHOSS|nr:hypothetical protein RHSIM_Rhsim12G0066800 [Rhododendron simsii]
METRRGESVLCLVALFCFWTSANSLLSPKGVNFEVVALMDIKDALVDPHGVLNWDRNAVDPCSWTMITCSTDKLVIGLGTPSQNISGTLSPSIGNLTNLQIILLQNNNISGPIPPELGRLPKLQTLDLSDNFFTGGIPSSLAHLKSLKYLRLNNNSLSGSIPSSLANMTQLAFLDLSFNNLTGPVPRFLAKTFNLLGNPMICATGTENDCNGTTSVQLSYPFNSAQSKKLGLVWFILWFLFSLSSFQKVGNKIVCVTVLEPCFDEINLWKKAHSGKTPKVLAVKRLKDGNASGGEIQFQTEVEMISLAVHRNLLRLYGFCMTASERLLVYPYMSNGSVASCLKAKPALDWGTRKRIALGAARGLLYLHEQCDPKIIHRDVKAANILLDDDYEVVVGDFGLAKLLDHRDSHVTTAVRGTVGHIAPEYLSTGQSSEKTDVFGFGILLLELITGQRALEFGKSANQKGAMLDWVKKIHQEKKLDTLVDKDLKTNYDRIELEEMVQVALICTQFLPSHRPKMSEVVRMLEGDGLAEKWEASQRADATRCRANDFSSSERYSDLTDDSSLLVQAMELSGPR